MSRTVKKVGKLRYSEAFYSVQGEGKFQECPSVYFYVHLVVTLGA